ncbi:HAD family phosphatase [Rhodoferax sp.]|uniref:HAD family hydrolase n=1 Tax=Rhodoferax sp. TaxID=50421 RepID=UPI0025D3BBE3|nr:HAD family phosphatase [Rhodoferax sp.]
MSSRLKAVLFDHDGTLVESEAVHHAIWNEVLQPYGVQIPVALFMEDFSGVPAIANGHDLKKRYALAPDAVELADTKNRLTAEYLATHAFPLMPGVRESLSRLHKAGLRRGVVTGARRFAIAATLRSHALASEFEIVISADEVVHSKPAPDCYLLALEKMGLQRHEAVAFEDTEHGVASAVAAGLACVAIPTAMSAVQDFSAATVVVTDMASAVDWVLKTG